VFLVLARQCLIKKRLDLCSTQKPFGRHAGIRYGHQQLGQSSMTSTAW